MKERGRVRVKICGITSAKDALLCAEAGADALGFVLWPGSPRAVSPSEAKEIVARLPPFIDRVGVFVDEDPATVAEIARAIPLDWVQLSGDEDRSYCQDLARRIGRCRIMKTFRVDSSFVPEEAFSGFLIGAHHLDAKMDGKRGGTGRTVPWKMARRASDLARDVVLAGGLRPDNVREAIQAVRPAAVDVASALERAPGKKDPGQVRAFLWEVRR